MNRFFLLLCLVFLTAISALYAQRPSSFSDNPGEFTAQLQAFMTEGKQTALEESFKAFEAALAGGAYPAESFQLIHRSSNAMLTKRLSAAPYFKSYLDALLAVLKSENPPQRIQDFHRILEAMLAESDLNNNDLLQFMDFAAPFFERRALRDPQLGTSWYTLSDTYRLRYENKKPTVVIEKTKLMATRNTDTIYINETSGILYPLENLWKGQGGRVNWERQGLNDVYVLLDEYSLEVNKGLYEVPKVRFFYPLFLGPQPVEGKFSDKLIAGEDATVGSYPRFESAQPIAQIQNVGKGVTFSGWFRLYGQTVYGFGTRETPAVMQIFNTSQQLLYQGQGTLFTIKRDELVTGERVQSALFFGKDTLLHPSVNIRYQIPLNLLQLSRGQFGSDRNPFFSTQHRLSIEVDRLSAYFERDSIYFGEKSIANTFKKDVFFESLHFFKKADYQRIQSIASQNPLMVMRALAEREGRWINADMLARAIDPKFSSDNIQTLLNDLVGQGFIQYDTERQLVEIKDKVYHYVNADAGKADYDLLRIESNYEEGPNAAMNMRNGNILMRGVDKVEFSYRQRVALKPDSSRIVLRADRGMEFDGRLFAGYTLMEGNKFRFDYKKFLVHLDSISYLDFFLPTGTFDENRNPEAFGIQSRIEKLKGALLIDAPGNKSGKDNIAMFPSIEIKSPSFVYYDYPEIQEGIYVRDSFYFELAPFSFQHADAISAKDLIFKGVLYSSDILPPLQEVISLQEDRSLGFNTSTPEGGLPVYQSKGRYSGALSLSHKGLLGQGNLSYLGASVNARDVVFKPEELNAKADRFDLEEARNGPIQTPQVRGEQVAIQWRPYRDSLYVRSETAPFALFKDDNHTLEGTLILTPGGLKGNGTLSWDKANLSSNQLTFGAYSTTSDTSTVQIKTQGVEGVALRTQNVQSDVDYERKTGLFKANNPGDFTDFPFNQYQTSLSTYTWDMEAGKIRFDAEPNRKGRFRSIHPDQDSLSFEGNTAVYDLITNELAITEVPVILSADAFIYPDSGLVSIESGGDMRPLQNARIIADTLNKNHVINRATVQIRGKRFYQADGYYEYNIGAREQEIHFQNIVGQPVGKGKMSEKPAVTRANGEVSPDMNFFIDHKTSFKGTISLNAESKALKFDGFAKLEAEKLPWPEWFSISCEADKDNLIVPYDTPKSENGDPLRTGLYLGKEDARVYPLVMQTPKLRKDRDIFPATGYFRYDKTKDQYYFGDSVRIFNAGVRGNIFTFKNFDGSVEADGRFKIGSALKYITVDAAGFAKGKFPPPPTGDVMLEEDTTAAVIQEVPVRAELMTGIKMTVPDQLTRIMINDFKASDFSASPIVFLTDLDYYRRAATQLFPEDKDINEAISGLSSGYLDIPKRVNPYTFLFSRLKLKWDQEYQSFITTEPNSGLVSIAGENINRVVPCMVEFRMPSNDDDRLYIYIKSPSGQFYFFGFKQGILNVTSDNPEFMSALAGMKSKDLVLKMPDGENYEIQPLEETEAQRFVRRIQAAKK